MPWHQGFIILSREQPILSIAIFKFMTVFTGSAEFLCLVNYNLPPTNGS